MLRHHIGPICTGLIHMQIRSTEHKESSYSNPDPILIEMNGADNTVSFTSDFPVFVTPHEFPLRIIWGWHRSYCIACGILLLWGESCTL